VVAEMAPLPVTYGRDRGTRAHTAATTGRRSAQRGRLSACPEQEGKTARAYFGPDYARPSLASLRPRYRQCQVTRMTRGSRNRDTRPGRTSLVRALALHGVARPAGRLRSHLASPLEPGKGVLIRRVSRPAGSVACVREDASPNEVSHENLAHDSAPAGKAVKSAPCSQAARAPGALTVSGGRGRPCCLELPAQDRSFETIV
jgi:hypothetical protein